MDQKKPPNVVVSGLIKRRRDIQAKSDYLTRQFLALQQDLDALDKSINIIDPTFDLKTIKPKQYLDPERKLLPYQSEVAQMLSDREKPLTLAEICDKLIEGGHPCESSEDRKKIRDKIKNHLVRKVKSGWIVKENSRYRLSDSLLATTET